MKSLINRLKATLYNKKFQDLMFFTALKFLAPVLGFVSNIYIVRKISKFENGTFNLALMFVSLITVLGFTWHNSVYSYYGSVEINKHGNMNKTFWAKNVLNLFGMIVLAVLYIFFRKQANDYIGAPVAELVVILSVIRVLKDNINDYYMAIRKQTLSSVIQVVSSVVTLILVLLLDLDIYNLLIIYIVSDGLNLLFLKNVNWKHFGKFEFDREHFIECLKFGLSQMFGFAGLYIVNFGDNVVIKQYMSVEDVGMYSVAYKMFDAFVALRFVFVSYFASSLSIAFHKNDNREISQFYYKIRSYVMGVLFLMHLFLFVFADFIFNLFFGSSCAPAVPVYRLLVVGSFFHFFTTFYVPYLNIMKKYLFLQTMNVVRAIFNITLDFLLISGMGLRGPALATTIAIVLNAIVLISYCERKIFIMTRKVGDTLSAGLSQQEEEEEHEIIEN